VGCRIIGKPMLESEPSTMAAGAGSSGLAAGLSRGGLGGNRYDSHDWCLSSFGDGTSLASEMATPVGILYSMSLACIECVAASAEEPHRPKGNERKKDDERKMPAVTGGGLVRASRFPHVPVPRVPQHDVVLAVQDYAGLTDASCPGRKWRR